MYAIVHGSPASHGGALRGLQRHAASRRPARPFRRARPARRRGSRAGVRRGRSETGRWGSSPRLRAPQSRPARSPQPRAGMRRGRRAAWSIDPARSGFPRIVPPLRGRSLAPRHSSRAATVHAEPPDSRPGSRLQAASEPRPSPPLPPRRRLFPFERTAFEFAERRAAVAAFEVFRASAGSRRSLSSGLPTALASARTLPPDLFSYVAFRASAVRS